METRIIQSLGDMPAYLTARDTGAVVEVSSELYYYFLNVLPPVRFMQPITIKGERRRVHFGFAEGEEQITAFWESGDRYFCQLSDEWNEGW